jgi:hypothetical protein
MAVSSAGESADPSSSLRARFGVARLGMARLEMTGALRAAVIACGVVCGLLCGAGSGVATAQTTYTFTGAAGSSWSTPANWSPNGVPSTLDSVVLSSGTLDIGTSARTISSLTFSGGEITGGDLTLRSSFTWNAGILGGTGQLIVTPGASASFAGPGAKILARRLVNSGALTYSGNALGLGRAGANGTITNQPIATITIPDAGSFFPNSAGANEVINRGTIVKTGLSASFVNVPLTNEGTIDVRGGQVVLSASMNNRGTLNISAGAVLSVSGNFAQASNASLVCQIAGAGASQVGRVDVGGSAILDGTLSVTSVGGYTPVGCRSVSQIINATTVSGRFASTSLPSAGAARWSWVQRLGSTVSLVVGNPADIGDTGATPGADGQIDNGDFQLFVASFFSPTGTIESPESLAGPADIADTGAQAGADDVIDNGDFQLFIAGFFSGCQ